MSKRINKETEQKAIELYQSGLSMAKVGEECGITAATVLAILKRNDIPRRTKGGIYKIPDEEVIQRYQAGESCQSIADSFGVVFHTISNILERHNIKRDNKYQNKSLNEFYFNKIDSIDKAYFLGFMLADGNVSLKENIIRLSLSSKDEKILNIFKDKSGNSNKITIREDGNHSERTFQLRSSQWKEDLAKYSVTPQKTHTSTMPVLEDKFMSHLLRGMIDGDGWISSASHQIGFCGNEKTVTQVRDFLVKKLNVYKVRILHPNEHLWQITWASQTDIEKIGNYLYQDKQDCFLERKYNNFLQIIHGNTEVTG